MTKWKLAGTTATAALLAANTALADITPEEVWQNWQDLAASNGQTVTTTSVARDGDTLVVTGMSAVQNQNDMRLETAIDEIAFTDNGDGTVNVTMSDSYLMNMTVPPEVGVEGATPTTITIAIEQAGLLMTASGTPEETYYALEAPTIKIALDSVEGVAATDLVATAEATLSTVGGGYVVSGPADAKILDIEFSAETIAMNIVAKDDDSQTDVQMIGTMADLGAAYNFDLSGMAEMNDDIVAALKAGRGLSGSFAYGAMDFTVDVTDTTGPSKIATTATGGGATFAMDSGGLVYEVNSTGTSIAISGPQIPFPELNISFGEIAMALSMPLLASTEATDFSFLTSIVDLAVSEEVWAMFDPANNLPHDPATVVIDTKGTLKLTTDLIDEAAMLALGDAAPGEVYSLDITELRASAVGAQLTGAGAFTFDNTDMATFDGVPAPTGKLDLKLVGGNTLLDKLVAMGLLTQDDANGARMMISMFANPGATDEELTSTLEFKDKGFYANGQRLQ